MGNTLALHNRRCISEWKDRATGKISRRTHNDFFLYNPNDPSKVYSGSEILNPSGHVILAQSRAAGGYLSIPIDNWYSFRKKQGGLPKGDVVEEQEEQQTKEKGRNVIASRKKVTEVEEGYELTSFGRQVKKSQSHKSGVQHTYNDPGEDLDFDITFDDDDEIAEKDLEKDSGIKSFEEMFEENEDDERRREDFERFEEHRRTGSRKELPSGELDTEKDVESYVSSVTKDNLDINTTTNIDIGTKRTSGRSGVPSAKKSKTEEKQPHPQAVRAARVRYTPSYTPTEEDITREISATKTQSMTVKELRSIFNPCFEGISPEDESAKARALIHLFNTVCRKVKHNGKTTLVLKAKVEG
ncbi:hypothetical protein GEMRC1_012677 [Eukaryota sp. GEM-RC1]